MTVHPPHQVFFDFGRLPTLPTRSHGVEQMSYQLMSPGVDVKLTWYNSMSRLFFAVIETVSRRDTRTFDSIIL